MDGEKIKEVNRGLELIAKSSVIVLIAFIFSKIFGYIYRIIIARYFGPEIYGLFSLSIVIVGWFVAISSLGFIEGVVRYVSFYRGKKENKKISYLFSFSSKILLASTVFSAVVLFILSEQISVSIFKNYDLIIFLKIFSVMLPLWVFGGYFLAVMRGFEKIKEVSVIESIIQNISKVTALIFFVLLGFGTNATIFSFFFGIFVMFFLSLWYCRNKIPELFLSEKINKADKKKIISEFVSYSWPILFLGIISSLFYWIDSFSIGFFKSVTEVGLYNAIIPIAILMNLAPEIFMQLFFPMITKDYSMNKIDVIKETSKRVGKWILMINLPVFFIMFFFPETIILLLFGQEYVLAADALRILSIGALFSSIFLISNNLLSMAGKSKIILYDIIIASITNFALNYFLVPAPKILWMDNSLGINGAAVATVISIVIFNLLFLFQAKRYTGIVPLKKEMLKIILISLVPVFLLSLALQNISRGILSFFMLSISFILLYIFLLFVFGIFDEEDVNVLRTIKNRIKKI